MNGPKIHGQGRYPRKKREQIIEMGEQPEDGGSCLEVNMKLSY